MRGPSGPKISIFLEDRICFFVNVGVPKRQLTMIFLRNRLKLFYKTVTLYYLLASLAPPSNPAPEAVCPPHPRSPLATPLARTPEIGNNNNGNVIPSYSQVAQNRETFQGNSSNIDNFLLGSGSSNGASLLASGPLSKKLFFYVGNVAGQFSSTDIENHLIEKIKVNSDILTCFPVTRNVNKSFQEAGRNALVEPNEEPTKFPKAFRVCISARDKHKFLNMNLWPKDVLIRTMEFQKEGRN